MSDAATRVFRDQVLARAGQAGALILATDWSESALGPIERWPQSLRNALSVCLTATSPMRITWGADQLSFGNDAYRAAVAQHSRHASVAPAGPLQGLHSLSGSPELHGSDVPLFDELGAIVGVVTSFAARDEARFVDPVVLEAPEPLRQLLFEQSPVAICATRGPQHRFELANAAYERMVQKHQLVGRPIAEVFPEIIGTPLQEVFDRVYRTGEPFVSEEFSVPLDRKGKGIVEECFFRFNLVARRDAAGAVSGWMCMAVEITELVRARREAEAARKLLETIIAQMHTGIIVAEAPSGQMLFANGAVERMLGPAPLPTLTQTNFHGYRAFHADGGPYAAEDYPVSRVLHGEQLIDHELRVIDGRGELRTLCMNATPVHDSEGERVAVVVAFYDITERKESEQQRRELLTQAQEARLLAEQASRAKDEFMAILGHELRNPLAPITTALHLMERASPGQLVAERAIIQRQVDHLVHLVDDLLDISRVTGGKVQLKRRRVEIAEILSEACEMTAPLIQERGHTLTIEAPRVGQTVYADVARMAQVFANLLTNAAKYTERGGRVTVDARRKDDEVVVCVRDSGMGIEPGMLPRVFEMFAQERQALDRSRGGLGLGLSIARSLVLLHGGTIAAFSDGAGQGSAFVVRLPLETGPDHVEARPSDPLPSPRVLSPEQPLSAQPVLVVDDNEDAALTLKLALKDFGHQVYVAHDGPSALALAAECVPALGLLDIGLPGMDGYELARRLRERFGNRVRLVAVTGYGQASDRERALSAGFDAHVVKPLQMDRLEAILDDLRAERERAP
ncbi:MAG: two-component hybrid sensor and regulator [Myxococcaceae bacterium]|nr:two-component hybrid sensor and regulator [Myxococcaceae bacterium]